MNIETFSAIDLLISIIDIIWNVIKKFPNIKNIKVSVTTKIFNIKTMLFAIFPPKYIEYTTDVFDNLTWEWEWTRAPNRIYVVNWDSLIPLCEKCGYICKIEYADYDPWYNTGGQYSECLRCGTIHLKVEEWDYNGKHYKLKSRGDIIDIIKHTIKRLYTKR